jgi:beta-glucosidase
MGVEWARIEPSEGAFSEAELDHYARMLEACRARGLKPMVTLNHFTTPLWFAKRGGFEAADAPAIFARYCRKVVEHLGGLMDRVTTFNEANIRLLVDLMPGFQAAIPTVKAAIAAAAKATDSPRFSRLAYADPQVVTPIMIEAHRLAYDAIKQVRPALPVGLTLTTQDIQSAGIPAWSRSISAGSTATGSRSRGPMPTSSASRPTPGSSSTSTACARRRPAPS